MKKSSCSISTCCCTVLPQVLCLQEHAEEPGGVQLLLPRLLRHAARATAASGPTTLAPLATTPPPTKPCSTAGRILPCEGEIPLGIRVGNEGWLAGNCPGYRSRVNWQQNQMQNRVGYTAAVGGVEGKKRLSMAGVPVAALHCILALLGLCCWWGVSRAGNTLPMLLLELPLFSTSQLLTEWEALHRGWGQGPAWHWGSATAGVAPSVSP